MAHPSHPWPALCPAGAAHLVLGDLLVRVDAHHQEVPHGLGLPQGVGVAEVDHVIAAVTPHPGPGALLF